MTSKSASTTGSLRDYGELVKDIEQWIADSADFMQNNLSESIKMKEGRKCLGVVKYFKADYLEGFLTGNNRKKIFISSTAGFTWGDGVYLTPLQFPRSGMMYGRVGVLGWFKVDAKRVYNAIDYRGISLYQEWITHHIVLYRMLTTTIHSETINRKLRNHFKSQFNIQVVVFRPDELAKGYVDKNKDIWLVISEQSGLRVSESGFSTQVENCEWVSVIGDEFKQIPFGRRPLLSSHIGSYYVFHQSTFAHTGTFDESYKPSDSDLSALYQVFHGGTGRLLVTP